MNFTSLSFLPFLPVVLAGYYIFPKNIRWIHLLAFSYFFYACHDLRLLCLILITTFSSYLCGIAISRAKSHKTKKTALTCTLIICLGILFLFKYLNFTFQTIVSVLNLFGAELTFHRFSILLPVGISFYTFQTLSYVIDVYRGTIPAEKHLGYYALFVVFFPQLVAGPIERPKDLLPQLKQAPCATHTDFFEGLCLFLSGYTKKMIIADYFSQFVDTAYKQPSAVGGFSLLIATFLFAFQIYCDFSGYTDIARGCAKFLGITLSENFRRPYQAISIRDFWHRWHLSLTQWFTDYVYIPLGGSKKGLVKHCRNILITFLMSGLWHGANFTYIIWGGLHGLFLITETLYEKKFATCSKTKHSLQKVRTFVLVSFAWIFFRADTVKDALLIVRKIFTDWQLSQSFQELNINSTTFIIIILLLLLLHYIEQLPTLQCVNHSLMSEANQFQTQLLYFLLYLTIIICRCLILIEHGSTTFIYFQF